MEGILNEIQTFVSTIAYAAVAALCAYAFSWLREKMGIEKSESNEEAIRRAALTEAGKLIQTGEISSPDYLAQSAAKIIADLHTEVKEEGYDPIDVKDMIIGAAATVFPPVNLLKLLK